MRTARIFAAMLLTGLLPTFAQAATYYYPSQSTSVYITRAEFVRMVMEKTGTFYNDGTHCFTDVQNQSYATYVCAAKQQGIVTGKPDGSFMPVTPISFVEAAAVIVRAERASVTPGPVWYSGYLQKVSEWNAVPSSVMNITDMLTYSQASEFVDAAMNRMDDNKGDDPTDDEDEDDNNDEIDLRVEPSDDEVEEDDTVTFRIRLENDDDDDLEDVEVRAFFDEDEFEFVSASDDADEDDDEVEWDDIEIEEDETKTLLLTLRVDDADEGDKLTVRVEADYDGSVSKASAMVEVEDDDDDDDEGDLKLSITDSLDPAEEEDEVVYTIRIENEDNNEIRVDVNAILDENMDYVSSSDNGDESHDEVEWDDIRIAEGATKSITLTVRIDDDARDGDKLELRVEANDVEETETTSIDDDDDDDDDTGDEDIDVSIVDSHDPVREGDTVTYSITLRNDENDDAEFDVRAELDEGMTFLSATQGGEEDDDVVEWENYDLDEDETRVVTFTVRINNNVDDGDTLRVEVSAGDGEDTETTRVQD